jgi:hypothetical protein
MKSFIKYVIKEIITDMYLFYQINVWLLKAKNNM